MSVVEQFAGLDMKNLIGGPLSAAADASLALANSTADFINKVGFDADGKLRTAAFSYQRRSMNDDGTSNLDEMKVDVPMLAIVPIPNLQVDEVNILFDMEVKQSEKSESSTDLSATASGTANFGIFKVSVTGSVSSHESNTRSSDNSAKYHVDVRATNHGIPEGLARVLDMMAANISPSLVNSQLKDGNGQDLSDTAKNKAEKLKQLRADISNCENNVSAAANCLDGYIKQLRSSAVIQKNTYQARATDLISHLGDSEEDKKKAEEYGNAISEVNQSWTDFSNRTADLIKLVSDSGAEENKVSALFALKMFGTDGAVSEYVEGEAQYQTIATLQGQAVTAQKNCDTAETALLNKKAEYNTAIMGGSTNDQQPAQRALPVKDAVRTANKALEEAAKHADTVTQPEV